MTLLEAFVASPLAASLGWALLASLWQGAIVATAIGAVLLASRSPRIRYAACCLAMLAVCAAFAFTLLRNWPVAIATVGVVHRSSIPAWNVRVFAAISSAWRPSLRAFAPWLVPFWILGVAAFAARNFVSLAAVRRLRHRGVCVAPRPFEQQLAQLCARLRLMRPVTLLESCFAETPIVAGYFRPLILVPVGVLTGLPPAQIEAILLHELAHVRRCDYLVNTLQRAVEALFFYNPAIWWISRVIRIEREHCCDDLVLAISQNPQQYALALAALEQTRRPVCNPALAATGGILMKRIRRILYPQPHNGAWPPAVAVILVLMTAALALGAWRVNSAGHLIEAPQAAQTASHPALPEKYSKWLNEEVIYIIDDRERAAFEKLSTNEERDQFIEQFWERRNPTPGSAENPFKEEHYRRIAYANRHFPTASGRPGWQTDRGHMYVVYGPPDEIDAHPAGRVNLPHASEVWIYRHLQGIGDSVFLTFIVTEPGDYRLAPGSPTVSK